MPLGSDHTCAKLHSSRFRQTIAGPNYQGGNDGGCEVHRTVRPIPRELRGCGPANGRARIPNDPQHSVRVGQGVRGCGREQSSGPVPSRRESLLPTRGGRSRLSGVLRSRALRPAQAGFILCAFRRSVCLWNSAFLSPKRPMEELRLLLLLRAKGKEKRNNKCQDTCASRRSYKSTKEAVLGDAKERCRNHASNKGCYHKPSEHLPASRSVTRVSSTKQGPLGSTWGKQCYSSLPHARACFAPRAC